MKSFASLAAGIFLLFTAVFSAAQSATITATQIANSYGLPLGTGKFCFGQNCLPVTNGALGSQNTVPQGTANISISSFGSEILVVPNVTISAPSFSWDAFILGSTQTALGPQPPLLAAQPGATYLQTYSNQRWNYTGKGWAQQVSAATVTPIAAAARLASSIAVVVSPQRATLIGEYLLNEGTGSIAHDTSGNGNDGTIAGAVWEGTQDLNFPSNSNQYIQLPPAINATKTWMIAAYFPLLGYEAAPLAPGYGAQSNFAQNPAILCGTTSGQLCLIAGSPGTSQEFQAFNTDGTTSSEPMPAGWHIFTLVCGNSTLAHEYFDGVEVGGYSTQGTNTCPTPPSGNYQVGGSTQFTGTWFTGKIGGTWAWSSYLGTSDVYAAAQAALGYLAQKGIATNYRKVPSNNFRILAGLDSRTYGIGLSGSTVWPATMVLSQPFDRVNYGVPGAKAFDTCNQFDLSFGLQSTDASAPVITVLWGGVNDMLFSGQSARQVANNLKCLVQKAKKLGRVVIATEISCSGTFSNTGGTCDSGKNTLNPIIRAEAFAWGADNIADLATETHVGIDGGSAIAACMPDGLHPGPGCEPYISAVMADAVNELIGSNDARHNVTAAATYTEVAGDRFLDLTSATAQAITLVTCTGKSLPRIVANTGAAASTVAGQASQAITGSATVVSGARAIYNPIPGPGATAGCSWFRVQ